MPSMPSACRRERWKSARGGGYGGQGRGAGEEPARPSDDAEQCFDCEFDNHLLLQLGDPRRGSCSCRCLGHPTVGDEQEGWKWSILMMSAAALNQDASLQVGSKHSQHVTARQGVHPWALSRLAMAVVERRRLEKSDGCK